MIVALSTSSPVASVALLGIDGESHGSGSEAGPASAGGACLRLLGELLDEAGQTLSEVKLFVADLGPGSFTGTRVGVTLAKTLAYSCGARAAGVTSFDLIDHRQTAVVPFKKSERFIRRVGQEPFISGALPIEPYAGYGDGVGQPAYPFAGNVSHLLGSLTVVDPFALMPSYLAEPAITQPKQHFARGAEVA